MKTELRTRWLQALRSGQYQQTTGYLRDDKGFCCLGVLCEIDPDVKKLARLDGEYLYDVPEGDDYRMCVAMLTCDYENQIELKSPNYPDVTAELMKMNDGDGDGSNRKTFSDIADFIERNIPAT